MHTGLDIPSATIGRSIQTTSLANYWSSGIDLCIGTENALSSNIWLVPSFQYVRYTWNNYNYQGTMPTEIGIVSAKGENSEIYRISLEGRFIGSHKFIVFNAQLYFTTGLAYSIERIGSIRVTYDDLNGPNFTHQVTYPNREYWNHTLGIGTRANVVGPFDLDISAKYFTDYKDGFYTCYNFGVAYSLSQ
jgi:hypothetical protein